MSLIKLPNLRLYWSTDPAFRTPQIAEVMTRDRFEQILKNIHFSDNTKSLPRNHVDYDRAIKIRPLINHINSVMPEAYSYSKKMSVDEHMVKFKGQNRMKQYMKDKPVSWGFKLWCLCEAETGFLYNVDLYTGKKDFVEHGLGESVVLKLVQPLKKKNIEVYFDNFFTSVNLLYILKKNHIMACGTIRTNRKNVPKTFPADREMKRGDVAHYTSKGVSIVKWMDNRAVFLASNFIDPSNKTVVKRRVAGNSDKIEISCPEMIKYYNKGMGGVDLMDQKKVYYEFDRKSKCRFYMRLFFDLFEICIHNTFIIQSKLNINEKTNMTSLEFRSALSTQLINGFISRKISIGICNRSKKLLISKQKPHVMKKNTHGWKRCYQCKNVGKYNRTNVYCEQCNVFLCFTASRQCFDYFHLTQ